MANDQKLFAEFPEVSTSQWEEVITADLKGADDERKLVWKTEEGFNDRPYYRAENLKDIPFLASESGQFPFVRGTKKSNQWRVHQSVCVKNVAEANAEALKLLNGGIDSLQFNLTEALTAESLSALLKDIVLTAVELTFCGAGMPAIVEPMLALMKAQGAEKAHVHFVIDPVINHLTLKGEFACCESGANCFDKISELMKLTADFKNVRIVSVSGENFHNSGSTIVQELAFTLSAGHEYLLKMIEAGVPVDTAARKIRFSMAVSSNYFMEIAKFRAGRLLWANIVKAYNPEQGCPAKMYCHAVTSTWNQSVYDPYVNMLRGTTEAMSASIAGVHSLEVLPFNKAFETPTDFSKRIARNEQLLLKHESHFDVVSDPSGGSYYIENLTQSISEQAWKLFCEVEAKGGYVEAFKSGFIVEQVKKSAEAKDKKVATRRTIILGANQYPNFTEVADKGVDTSAVERKVSEGNYLAPYRGSMAFEQMRLTTDRSGRELKAFMLTCGSLSMARARSQFACNFFACAGIKVQDNTYFKSVEQGVKEALEAKADIVVICASDDDYQTLAPEAKALLGDKAVLVVAGAPACAEELQAQGITNFISVKSNVLETLKGYVKQLGI